MIYMIPIVAIIAGIFLVVAIVFAVTSTRRRKYELQAEVQSKLIDRFSSSQELVAFLNSPEGKEFVTGARKEPARAARDKIIGGIRVSIILGALGLAFLAMWFFSGDFGFAVPAFILLGLGVGYLVASLVAIRLSQSLRSLDSREPSDVQ